MRRIGRKPARAAGPWRRWRLTNSTPVRFSTRDLPPWARSFQRKMTRSRAEPAFTAWRFSALVVGRGWFMMGFGAPGNSCPPSCRSPWAAPCQRPVNRSVQDFRGSRTRCVDGWRRMRWNLSRARLNQQSRAADATDSRRSEPQRNGERVPPPFPMLRGVARQHRRRARVIGGAWASTAVRHSLAATRLMAQSAVTRLLAGCRPNLLFLRESDLGGLSCPVGGPISSRNVRRGRSATIDQSAGSTLTAQYL